MFPVSFVGTKEGSLCSPILKKLPISASTHTVTLTCPGCGWRQTDFIPAEAREAACQSYHIDSAEDLQIRVIRGSACTVRLVELDLEVRPGSHSTGYVSNIEGVLNRFRSHRHG